MREKVRRFYRAVLRELTEHRSSFLVYTGLRLPVLLERTSLKSFDALHAVHNYIDTQEMILRKGTIAAHAGERVLIPINMRGGSVLAVGSCMSWATRSTATRTAFGSCEAHGDAQREAAPGQP